MSLTKRFFYIKKIDYSIFTAAIFCVVSFVLLAITFYKSEIVFNGLNRSHYFIYYLASFLGASLSAGLFFVSKKTRTETVLILVALLIGLFASEFVFGVLLSGNSKLTERQYLLELLKKEKSAVPRLLPGFFVESDGIHDKNKIFPLAGLSKRLTVHCNESGEMITYLSDRHGFNNPDKVWTSKPLIVTIGDSFTQGDCVAQSKTIASNLRNITRKNAINLGMGGNGPLIEYATLAEYAKRLRPQYVLWFFFEGNDLFDLITEQQSNFLLSYLKEGVTQSLIDRQDEVDETLLNWLKSRDHNRDRYTITNFLMLKRIRGLVMSSLNYGAPVRDFDSSWSLMNTVLLNANKMTKSWGGEFIFVYLPSYARYSGDEVNQDDYLDKALLIESVRKLKIPVIDIHEYFLKEKDPLKFFPHRKNGHYNEAGYLIVSKSVAQYLQLNGKVDR